MGIEEMRAKRAELHAQMQDVLSRTTEDGGLSAEDAQEFDSREAEFDALTDTIKRTEKVASYTAPDARSVANPDAEVRTVAGVEPELRELPQNAPEYRAALTAYLRGGGLDGVSAEQRVALNTAVDGQGGFLVPEDWDTSFIEALTYYGSMWDAADVIQTTTGAPLHIAGVDDLTPQAGTGQNPLLVAEAGAFTQSEDTYNEIILNAYKYGHIVKVSDELLVDSMFDIDSHIRNRAARAVALRTGELFVTADGTNKPRGIIPAATLGKTFAANNAIAADELFDVYYSVPRPYRAGASWLVNDSTVKALRKIKDADNQYLWQPGLQAGQPDLLLGRPVLDDPFVPAIGANATSMVFGDLSGYWIRRVGTASIKVLNELYAGNGQVGYRVDVRVDGDLVEPYGVRKAVHPA